jgi:thiamine biosynthesis protein ThiS
MKITLNNRQEEFKDFDKLTVQQLIEKMNFTFKFLVTKVNGKLIKKEEREKTFVYDGDEVAIIHLISGG